MKNSDFFSCKRKTIANSWASTNTRLGDVVWRGSQVRQQRKEPLALGTRVCERTDNHMVPRKHQHTQHHARIHSSTHTYTVEHSINREWYEFDVIYTNLAGHIYKYSFAKLLNHYQSFGDTRSELCVLCIFIEIFNFQFSF